MKFPFVKGLWLLCIHRELYAFNTNMSCKHTIQTHTHACRHTESEWETSESEREMAFINVLNTIIVVFSSPNIRTEWESEPNHSHRTNGVYLNKIQRDRTMRNIRKCIHVASARFISNGGQQNTGKICRFTIILCASVCDVCCVLCVCPYNMVYLWFWYIPCNPHWETSLYTHILRFHFFLTTLSLSFGVSPLAACNNTCYVHICSNMETFGSIGRSIVEFIHP